MAGKDGFNVKCKEDECGFEFESFAKQENIEGGKTKCKKCGVANLAIQPGVDDTIDKTPAGMENTCGDCQEHETECSDRNPLDDACDDFNPKPADLATEDVPETVKPTSPTAMGVAELQAKGDKARRKLVDLGNRQAAARLKEAGDKLANVPLTDEERAYCVETEAKMNSGRHVDTPSAAAILRYSKLRGRLDVPVDPEPIDE